ncbi:hypothetical protein DR66_6054 [Delftia acidovorans]|uniref:hypothetical protein n=1 Tax=Delftia acidovorans TaxID=80866 RepID=UPI0004FF97D4|nr:hypothetical protein [Delftia acidovorans]KFJ08892.1 hypothetical protein DR66_6054 [Delftia acidovorans]QQB48426.1 hypothetical protein I6H54_18790 [Delftia acidovorans]
MQRVIPSEPFNPDPDARFLRQASRPGPVVEPGPAPPPGGWLLLCLVLLVALALSACADAGAAQEPVASAADVQRAHSAAQACPPGHAVVWNGPQSMECLRELP